jgi:peptidoglycan/xylan/chitin deacetylase (PgdA/CDA1 family)
MSWLKSAGYTGVTLSAGLSLLNSPTSTHDTRPVVLTFDDGYQDFYTTACPALHEFGFSATMFLATQFVGACSSATNPARPSFKGINCLNWREVRELHAAGFEFGSHTRSHPVLYQLDWPAIAAEIRDSKSEIESQLGAAVKTFAYPYAFPEHDGEFVAHLGALLREAGFSAGATTQIGRVHSSAQAFFIPRLPMNSDDDEMLIRAKLAGDYDWLRTPQAALKRLKHVLHPRRRLQDGPVADQPSAPTALTGPRA